MWSADCALRVLSIFEGAFPEDNRPREAIAICRKWVRTGVFKMAEIRAASLGAHAAARRAKANDAACFAARAAGQAVATAHVSQHAVGGAFYALKAIAAADPERAEVRVTKELAWQSRRLAKNLREGNLGRIVIEKRRRGFLLRFGRGRGFDGRSKRVARFSWRIVPLVCRRHLDVRVRIFRRHFLKADQFSIGSPQVLAMIRGGLARKG